MNITEYILDVYNSFSNYVNQDIELCDLLSLRFDGGNVPDYNNVYLQEFYLLRFAYAYEFSYETMFEDVLQMFPEIREQVITALSIGCGSGLDAMGFYTQYGSSNLENLEYIGIDVVNWSHQYTNKNVTYINEDILDWLEHEDKINVGIISFPKSISEFETRQIKGIANRIGEINQSNDMYILVSLRTNEGCRDYDISKTEMLVKKLEEYGYVRVGGNEPNQYYHFTHPEDGIMKYNGYNGYPEEAMTLCSTLNELCVSKDICTECNKNVLTRRPALKVGNVYYQIIHVKR